MAEIFALQGPGNCGKSTTLRMFYEELLLKYPKAVPALLKDGRDFKAIVSNVKGKLIGIESQGDPNSRLDESLKEFQTAQCDIVFCACRSWGMTCDWIAEYCPPSTKHMIAKTRGSGANQFDRANKADMQSLFNASGL